MIGNSTIQAKLCHSLSMNIQFLVFIRAGKGVNVCTFKIPEFASGIIIAVDGSYISDSEDA